MTSDTVGGRGVFPLGYILDFLRFLHANAELVQVITYDDLPWGNDRNYRNGYPGEYQNWLRQFESGLRSPEKVYVILQHDVDSNPKRTLRVAAEEAGLGLPSNIMVFRQRVSRRHMQRTGALLGTDYELDYERLRDLQDKHRFVIGYHANAYERAMFDESNALALFEQDVAALREKFAIRYFAPHGGPPGPDGRSNSSLPIPDSLASSVRWVANRHTMFLDGVFSDGGLNGAKCRPAKRDLRDFVRRWRPGRRYRVLLHPQYYGGTNRRPTKLMGTRWYEEVHEVYSGTRPGNAWAEVKL